MRTPGLRGSFAYGTVGSRHRPSCRPLRARIIVASAKGPRAYERPRPEATLLYRVVLAHLSTFLTEMASSSRALPRYVVALEAYLACGILAHGFSRTHREDCRRSLLVAFSCKKRGIYPSCGARKPTIRL